MMASMYELTEHYTALLSMANDPEIDPEAIADTLESLSGDIEEKAENTAKVLCEMKSQIVAIDAEMNRLSERKHRLVNSYDSLIARLEGMMRACEKKKIETPLFTIRIQKNGGQPKLIWDTDDVSKLPKEFVETLQKPSNRVMREYLKEHGESEFAHFEDRGESLRIS